MTNPILIVIFSFLYKNNNQIWIIQYSIDIKDHFCVKIIFLLTSMPASILENLLFWQERQMRTQIDHFANIVWQHFRKNIADYKSVLTSVKTRLACTVFNREACGQVLYSVWLSTTKEKGKTFYLKCFPIFTHFSPFLAWQLNSWDFINKIFQLIFFLIEFIRI